AESGNAFLGARLGGIARRRPPARPGLRLAPQAGGAEGGGDRRRARRQPACPAGPGRLGGGPRRRPHLRPPAAAARVARTGAGARGSPADPAAATPTAPHGRSAA
ncbi:MAG: hypothetical protein AVDCRST_MAG27-4081, partial [uncultured Craurococcus sp.]